MSAIPVTYGLGWDAEMGSTPCFSADPDLGIIESLVRLHLTLPTNVACGLTLLKGFREVRHKVYKVEVDFGPQVRTYSMRVAIPLDMPFRVNSEVASMEFARRHTTVPIPIVYAYDPTNKNDLRFPWILMEWIPGKPVDQVGWRSLHMDSKIGMVKQLAEFQSQLLDRKFEVIGSLHQDRCKVTPTSQAHPRSSLGGWILVLIFACFCYPTLTLICFAIFLKFRSLDVQPVSKGIYEDGNYLGQIVSTDFTLCGKGTTRGPFFNTADWISARLRDSQADYVRDLLSCESEDYIQCIEEMLSFTTRLLKLVPRLFPKPITTHEPTYLFLPDLSDGNVLVDENGRLSGLVGFEYAYTAPLWNFCQTPSVLNPMMVRIEAPPMDPERYPPDADSWDMEKDDIVDSGVCTVYFDELADYERTILRELYHYEIERRRPQVGWERAYHGAEGKKKREFLTLVESAQAAAVNDEREHLWLDMTERGECTDHVFDRPLFNNNGKVDTSPNGSRDSSDPEGTSSSSGGEDVDEDDATRVDSEDEEEQRGHFDNHSDPDLTLFDSDDEDLLDNTVKEHDSPVLAGTGRKLVSARSSARNKGGD